MRRLANTLLSLLWTLSLVAMLTEVDGHHSWLNIAGIAGMALSAWRISRRMQDGRMS